MQFSPDNRSLLSVSRDRKWALYDRGAGDGGDEFRLIASTNKQNGVHARIIWTCDWSHDSALFATGSRDGKCAVWNRSVERDEVRDGTTLGGYTSVGVFEIKDSITALSFAKSYHNNAKDNYLIALGCESGIIKVCCFSGVWKQLCTLDSSVAHHLTVRKLSFRPNNNSSETVDNGRHTLASCGNDHLVRIHELIFLD